MNQKPSVMELGLIFLLLQPWSAMAQANPSWDCPGPGICGPAGGDSGGSFRSSCLAS